MIVRPLVPGDDAAIARIFMATLVLGDGLAVTPADLEPYAALCLAWYLGPGRADAAVGDDDGVVGGYVLVCTAPAACHRWTRRAAVSYTLTVGRRLLARDYPPAAARFYHLRFRDGWALRRTPPPVRGLGHAHVNLVPRARAAQAGRLAAAHVDARIAAAGLPGWFGEINARAGERQRALERLGGVVVHRAPNRTLTHLLGRPVERLTVVRQTVVRRAA
ncbi:MAG: hypothetical protein NVSMB12_19370 [Acidimicrobiales bacterium]